VFAALPLFEQFLFAAIWREMETMWKMEITREMEIEREVEMVVGIERGRRRKLMEWR
jgi:hypothetical protein